MKKMSFYAQSFTVIAFLSSSIASTASEDSILQLFDAFNPLAGAICRLDCDAARVAFKGHADPHERFDWYIEDGIFFLVSGDDEDSFSFLMLLLYFDEFFSDGVDYESIEMREEKRYRLAEFLLGDCGMDLRKEEISTRYDELRSDYVTTTFLPIDLAVMKVISLANKTSQKKINLSVIKLFLQFGAVFTPFSLVFALESSCKELVDFCLNRDVNFGQDAWCDFESSWQVKPLVVACCNGLPEIVEKLLQAGVDPNCGAVYPCEHLPLMSLQVLLKNEHDQDTTVAIANLLATYGFNDFWAYSIILDAHSDKFITQEMRMTLLLIFREAKKKRRV